MQAKFLQHLNSKKTGAGFTLIELLVVIIIIGILAAIALPSFLSQANKGKQAEAKQNIATMNKSNQAYVLENGVFVTTIGEFGKLGAGIKTQTTNYTYALDAISSNGTTGAYALATPVPTIKAYIGGVALAFQSGSSDPITLSAICENQSVGGAATIDGITVSIGVAGTGGGVVDCNGNYGAIK